jgi:hypothetical protein
MSSDTIAGNSLQFTNDNKHAYAYSGEINISAGSSADVNVLEFFTNSEYNIFDITWIEETPGNADRWIDIRLNDVSVFKGKYDDSPAKMGSWPFRMIVPPFSHFEFYFGCSSTTKVTAVIASTVGMAQRVGNLDE